MISFIIPAYNEELELPSTIAAIKNAVGETQLHEIIVVDDASTDATVQIANNAGVRVVAVNCRQIAAARNAGARTARGNILLFVDADTRINARHVSLAQAALNAGYAGGSARVAANGPVPRWGRIFLRIFSVIYFGANLGAGAFLFTTRKNFDAVGGFDQELFVGEEVFFTLALRKIGRFKILDEPIVTSGRKLRMYSAREIFGNMFTVIIGGRRVAKSRAKLDIWYNGRRETKSAFIDPVQTDGLR